MFKCPCGKYVENSLEYGILVFRHSSDGEYCKYLNNFQTDVNYQMCREIINASNNNDVATMMSFLLEIKENNIYPLVRAIGKLSETQLEQLFVNLQILFSNKPYVINMLVHYLREVYGRTGIDNTIKFGLYDNMFISTNDHLKFCKKFCKNVKMNVVTKKLNLDSTINNVIANLPVGSKNLVYQTHFEQLNNGSASVEKLRTFNIPRFLLDVSKAKLTDDEKINLIDLLRNRLLALENNQGSD